MLAPVRPIKVQRRLIATVIAALALLATDGWARNPPPRQRTQRARVVKSVSFKVSAYCTGRRTATGTKVSKGVVAADEAVFRLGTVLRLTGLGRRYNGTYTVMDTGPRVRGRRLDIYMRDCNEAVRFGRRTGRVAVVRSPRSG